MPQKAHIFMKFKEHRQHECMGRMRRSGILMPETLSNLVQTYPLTNKIIQIHLVHEKFDVDRKKFSDLATFFNKILIYPNFPWPSLKLMLSPDFPDHINPAICLCPSLSNCLTVWHIMRKQAGIHRQQ